MATIAVPRQETARGTNPAPLLFALILFIAVAASAHALAKHALEAVAVTDGCNQHGPDMVIKTSGRKHPNSFWEVCETPDGDYGVRKIQCTAAGWKNITAFIPDPSQLARGTFARAVEYVTAKGDPFTRPLSEVCQ